MLRNHLFTAFFELARYRRPGIIRLDQCAARVSKRLSAGRIAEQSDYRVRKIVWCVGRQEVVARFERQPFGADGGRDHRFAHGERLENLDPRAAAGAKRHDIHGCLPDRGAHVINGAGDVDARPRGQLTYARAGVAADDRE